MANIMWLSTTWRFYELSLRLTNTRVSKNRSGDPCEAVLMLIRKNLVCLLLMYWAITARFYSDVILQAWKGGGELVVVGKRPFTSSYPLDRIVGKKG